MIDSEISERFVNKLKLDSYELNFECQVWHQHHEHPQDTLEKGVYDESPVGKCNGMFGDARSKDYPHFCRSEWYDNIVNHNNNGSDPDSQWHIPNQWIHPKYGYSHWITSNWGLPQIEIPQYLWPASDAYLNSYDYSLIKYDDIQF